MSDRIALLRHGRLEQVAPPQEIYQRPTTTYVASFIGQSNLLRCEVRSGLAACGALQFRTSLRDGAATFSLRPEAIQLASKFAATDEFCRFRATIKDQSFQGATTSLRLNCGDLPLTARVAGTTALGGDQEFAFRAADVVPVRESEGD